MIIKIWGSYKKDEGSRSDLIGWYSSENGAEIAAIGEGDSYNGDREDGVVCIRDAVHIDGLIYLLESASPIELRTDNAKIDHRKAKILSKLTSDEIALLGLTDQLPTPTPKKVKSRGTR